MMLCVCANMLSVKLEKNVHFISERLQNEHCSELLLKVYLDQYYYMYIIF